MEMVVDTAWYPFPPNMSSFITSLEISSFSFSCWQARINKSLKVIFKQMREIFASPGLKVMFSFSKLDRNGEYILGRRG